MASNADHRETNPLYREVEIAPNLIELLATVELGDHVVFCLESEFQFPLASIRKRGLDAWILTEYIA